MRFRGFTTIIVAIGVLAAGLGQIARAQDPTVFVSPATKNILPTSGNLILSVNISGVVNLHAFHVVFSLNNAVIRYAGRAEGDFLNASGGNSTLFLVNPGPGPAVSRVTVDDAILGVNSVSGDGTLFTVTIAPVANGSSSVSLDSISLRDGSNNPIPAQLVSGSVNVNNPTTVYVDPTYSSGNAGGHDFGYDGFNTLANGLTAVSSSGTITIAPSTYAVTFNVNKNVTLTPVSGIPVIQNLTLNTLSTILGGTFQVSGTLTLTSGVLTTGSNAISVTNSAATAVVITSGSVNGEVDRLIAATSTGPYLFTDANTLLRPDGTQGSVSTSIRSFPGTTPPNINGGSSINRYYVIASSGSLTAQVRLSYLDAEINGVPEPSMSLFQSSGTVWAEVTGIPNPVGNYVESADNVATAGQWTIGDADHPLPIQLASFTGNVLASGNVRLTWVTLSEVNNYGFYVQRKRPSDQGYLDVPNGFIAGNGTTNEPHTYTFTDVAPGAGTWMYRLKQVDLSGAIHFTEPIQIDVVTSVGGGNQPVIFQLKQNYPNPFNPATTIEFSVPKSGYTTLKVYNILGKEVASLVDGVVEAGQRSVRWDASSLPSGMYLYKITSGSLVATMKLVLMK